MTTKPAEVTERDRASAREWLYVNWGPLDSVEHPEVEALAQLIANARAEGRAATQNIHIEFDIECVRCKHVDHVVGDITVADAKRTSDPLRCLPCAGTGIDWENQRCVDCHGTGKREGGR